MSTIKMRISQAIHKRLKQVLKIDEVRAKKIFTDLGQSEGMFYKVRDGNTRPSVEVLSGLALTFDINLNWLILGKGRMHDPPEKGSIGPIRKVVCKEDTIELHPEKGDVVILNKNKNITVEGINKIITR